MEPEEFLSFAKNLRKNSDAANRSAVSRAYYAAHHKGRQYLNSLSLGYTFGEPPFNKRIHFRVYDCLGASGDLHLAEAGSSLKDLCKERNDADYELSMDKFNDRNYIACKLKSAEHIVLMLQTYLNQETSAIIKTEMKKYLDGNLKGCF